MTRRMKSSGEDLYILGSVTGCTVDEELNAARTLCRLVRRNEPEETWLAAWKDICAHVGLLGAMLELQNRQLTEDNSVV